MRFYLLTLFLCLGTTVLKAEDFSKLCADSEITGNNVSLFNCSQSALPKSLQKLVEANDSIGKVQCEKWYKRSSRSSSDFDFDSLKIFDKDKEKVIPLRCYCGNKIGKKLCDNKENFEKKVRVIKEVFEVRAWSVFLKDLISYSEENGNDCIEKIKEKSLELGCFEKIEQIHVSSQLHLESFNFNEKERNRFTEKNLDKYFDSLYKENKIPEGMTKDGLSYFPSVAMERKTFLEKNSLKEDEFYGLSSSSFEKKLDEIGKGEVIESFLSLLRSDASFENKMKKLSPNGEHFFSLTGKKLNEEDSEKRTILASHPDLGWMFNLNEYHSNQDNVEVRRKFKEFSSIAKNNKFSSLRELKEKFINKEHGECKQSLEGLESICKITGGHVLRGAKNVLDQGEGTNFFGFVTENSSETSFINKIEKNLECFDFKVLGQGEDDSHLLISERNGPLSNPHGDSPRRVVSKIESDVSSAINRVEGFERIAERIGKEKIEASNSEAPVKSEKVEALEEDFKGFLSNLKLPSGRNFSYPAGMDPAQAVANYKSEVYKWADDAVEKRISDIQGETDRIVNSDLPPLAKKKKLKELLDEVDRLNKGEFLEEIYKEKQNIGEYIARYEDKKRDWESQYGAEALENPKAVQAVAPPRDKTRSVGRGGSNSYKNVAGNTSAYVGSDSGSAAASSSVNDATAYIPPAPSVPFAQGSLMTRIVPKDEFQNNTVKASLLAKHKGYPIAVLDEKSQQVELYTPKGGTSYKLQETLTISQAEARGYVFPDDVKKLVESYRKDKPKGRAPSSFDEYEPTKKELLEKQKKLEKLQSLSDVMERQGVPRRARVVRLNSILDNL